MGVRRKFLFYGLIGFIGLQSLSAQILNVGAGFGNLFALDGGNVFTANTHLEYFIDHDAPFSFNVDPSFFIQEESVFTIPFYLKVVIGNRIKVCSLAGAFWRTGNVNSRGLMAGLSIESNINEKLIAFISPTYMRDSVENETYSPGGIPYTYTSYYNLFWINLGVRYSISFKK